MDVERPVEIGAKAIDVERPVEIGGKSNRCGKARRNWGQKQWMWGLCELCCIGRSRYTEHRKYVSETSDKNTDVGQRGEMQLRLPAWAACARAHTPRAFRRAHRVHAPMRPRVHVHLLVFRHLLSGTLHNLAT
eukprot:5601699-Pleurochrysis_carterae.AAC.1